ncbi:uroporphyrinogen-III synthase [Actinoalloteichus hoggarensis]|uniref:Bifunctional uroporphyrinogen-III synthetase/response regulator domain protein n=1 Tax=Actinoalloteichus hoggarensis TaxID=1470176 RepID=A0A221W0Z8_9PSEU|nr:uroporphyrinogen-III synthase [Actinoalloteichus hoggarensis]ASO19400.1 bifunctional uroporphyrinogen-III synthetase/response regulator domain protein [Actinoalloteichus hoggarensis]MBB5920638.1 uroporphyrinogen-III synthase [Actinoalloteichus hoggarensis]
MTARGAAEDELPPLAGFTVGVTAARRAEELVALLERKGAVVVHAPAIRIIPLADDARLRAATESVLRAPVDAVVVTTAIGFRGWLEAAEGWGLGTGLLSRLGAARLLTRGPKSRGAVRAAGLVETWSPPSESNAEMLDRLLTDGVAGRRVVVQLHGEPQPEFVGALRAAGADVVEVPVYRWQPPSDPTPLHRLVDAVLTRQVDALTFTSAPAVASLLAAAAETGREEPLLAQLRREVLAACVGSICAGPLVARGVPVVRPERARIGALVRELAVTLPARAGRLWIAAREVELRGHAAVVDGMLRPVPRAPMAVFRALAATPGRVVPRRRLLAALPTGGDEHAVETAIGRLRTALGEPRLVQTVVKRGYRLAVDPR